MLRIYGPIQTISPQCATLMYGQSQPMGLLRSYCRMREMSQRVFSRRVRLGDGVRIRTGLESMW